jgi:hypothetical protein
VWTTSASSAQHLHLNDHKQTNKQTISELHHRREQETLTADGWLNLFGTLYQELTGATIRFLPGVIYNFQISCIYVNTMCSEHKERGWRRL